MYQVTTATRKISQLTKRIKAIQGGTSASKTISILLLLINKAQAEKEPTITSICSENLPHLKRGAMRDFLNILEEHKYFKDSRWNKTDYVYTFETGSKIEFFGADQPDKVKGSRRNRLFINECNNVPYNVFDQLEVRTDEEVYLDWNPSDEFWFYDKVKPRDDVDYIVLTYRDNEALSASIRASMEQRRDNKQWWKVYGEGELGEIEGRIYKDWPIIDEIPFGARLERIGLDFGYTNDPTALIAEYYYNGGYIFDEITYQQGLSNKLIADILNNLPKALVVADSAEPKSIDELAGYGINIIGATKGAGSVTQGIQRVQSQPCSVTKRSVNTIKEQRNYLWMVDSDGRVRNVEDTRCANHSMSAIRYALQNLYPEVESKQPSPFEQVLLEMSIDDRTGYLK